MECEDRVVFITGTSSGFGLLTSIQLASDGYRVVATMRDRSKGEMLTQLAIEAGVSDLISIVQLDVSNELEVESVILGAIEQYGKIDVLINNSTFAARKRSLNLDRTKVSRATQSNLTMTKS